MIFGWQFHVVEEDFTNMFPNNMLMECIFLSNKMLQNMLEMIQNMVLSHHRMPRVILHCWGKAH
jgi:hypothetical protein